MKELFEKIKTLKPVFDKISPELLISMEYEYVGEKILIEIQTQEFSCVCPWSNLPDYALLNIKYIPNKLCVELKSLKYYIQSYRNVKIIHENAVNRIFNDLYKLLKPKYLLVELVFNIRGGIKTVVKKEKGKI
ncbi:MAG: preQ(1) synthase [Elusimicrobiota bacterium]|nr:preQ(1) synthase [Endomicrobiia bacterium]MCX7910495.1 preQ(1) synthase [Endomicrobiia bacterium]MDW8166005.1 preQ(1) synthase [Elusimicrobiota bacterium]